MSTDYYNDDTTSFILDVYKEICSKNRRIGVVCKDNWWVVDDDETPQNASDKQTTDHKKKASKNELIITDLKATVREYRKEMSSLESKLRSHAQKNNRLTVENANLKISSEQLKEEVKRLKKIVENGVIIQYNVGPVQTNGNTRRFHDIDLLTNEEEKEILNTLPRKGKTAKMEKPEKKSKNPKKSEAATEKKEKEERRRIIRTVRERERMMAIRAQIGHR